MNYPSNPEGRLSPSPSSNGATPRAATSRTSRVHLRELTFRDVVDLFSQGLLILRARWLAGLAAALVVGGLVAFALLRSPVESTARTVLFAQGTLDKVIGAQGKASNDALGLQLENTLRNHLSVMESRSFRARLLASFSPAERTAIAGPYLAPGRAADDDFFYALLASKISIERERGQEFFNVEVRHRNPATALMLANRFDTEYLALVQNQFRDANKQGSALLEQQAAKLRTEIAQATDARLQFREQNHILSQAGDQSIVAERLKRIDAVRTDARLERIRVETELNQVRASRAVAEFPWDNAYLANYGNNPALRQDLDRLLDQRSVLATRYGPSHPKMLDLAMAIAGVRANIQSNFAVASQNLEMRLRSAQKSETDLQAEFEAAFAQSVETEKLASHSDIFATEIEVQQQNLLELEKRIADAGLYSQLPGEFNFMQISDPAFLVRPRVSPRTLQIIFAALLALVTFVAAPLVIDLLDRRLKSTGDAESQLRLRVLGAIPILRKRQGGLAHIVRDGLDQASSDAFGDVIGEIDLISRRPFPKTILVSSTVAGEGKSMLVSNLAAAYAARGLHAVILDLDLRRPSQQRLHGIEGPGGFLPWARAGFPMEGLLEPGGTLGLQPLPDGSHLIPAGGTEKVSDRYLVGSPITRLLDELLRHFDVVLIDTPPAGLFQDALLLARHAHERLLVARFATASVARVRKVIADFAVANAPVTGVVLNGLRPRSAHERLAYIYRADRNRYYHPVDAGKRRHAAVAVRLEPVVPPAASQPLA